MPLKTEQHTTTIERRVRRAAREAGIVNVRTASVFFEHGQWWIENVRTGAIWSVVDAEGNGSYDGFGFEQITGTGGTEE
jgi:hypothetical protein